MPPLGFEPMILARARPQTYALDRAATGMDRYLISVIRYGEQSMNFCKLQQCKEWCLQ
jgi:hypothetical protein